MNIVLYVLDSLRADHVSAYGYDRDTTLNLDEMAENGVLFENCIAPGTWTRPVASSILSGLYPSVHGTYVSDDAYQPPTTSLPLLLKDAGYDNFAAVSGNMHSRAGFADGFDEYVDDIDQEITPHAENTDFGGTRGREINRAFETWLDDREGDSPFFSMLWSTGPHYPYAPPEEFRKYIDADYNGPVDGTPECLSYITSEEDIEQLVGYYDGEIQFNDYCIGQLRETLQERDEWEDTLFIAIGDHGDGFGEHPGFFGHGSMTPYEGLVHVPCIVRTPTAVSNRRVEEQISLVDLYPSILDWAAGEEWHAEFTGEIQGESFASVVDGESISGSEFVYASALNEDRGHMYRMVRSNERKHIRTAKLEDDPETERSKTTSSGSEHNSNGPLHLLRILQSKFTQWDERMLLQIARHPRYYFHVYDRIYRNTGGYLFDLSEDPEETRNLRESRPAEFNEWRNRLQNFVRDSHELRRRLGTETDDFEMGADLKERLAKLGYHEE